MKLLDLRVSLIFTNTISIYCIYKLTNVSWWLIALVFAFGIPGAVFAQSPSASQIEQQQLQRQKERQKALREEMDARPESMKPNTPVNLLEIPTGETPCFPISQLVVQGNHAEKFPWLAEASGLSLQGKKELCLGAKGVEIVLARMQQALVEHGLVTSRVMMQPQNLRQGILHVSFIRGVVRELKLERAGVRQPSLTNAIPIISGDALQLRDVEQGLENLKRVPSAEADIQIIPAQGPDARPGESDLLIKYQSGRPVRLSTALDDGGTKQTGKVQGTLTLSVDSPLSINDLVYVSLGHGVANGSGRGTNSQTLHYSVPYGYWLLAMNTSRNRYHQTVAGAFENYVYSGTSFNSDVKLSRILHRDGASRTSLGLRAFRRSSSSYIDDTEIDVQRRVTGGFELSVNHHQLIGQSVVDANVAYRWGTGAFRAKAAPEQEWGEGTSRMRLYTLDLSFIRSIQIRDMRTRFSSAWHGQWNSTPLTALDRIAIGGRYTVRGFDGQLSLSAERGWYWRNEWALPVMQAAETYLALDAGHVRGPSATNLVGRTLVGTAMGLRGTLSGVNCDVFVGTPIRKPTRFRTAGTTFGVNLSRTF